MEIILEPYLDPKCGGAGRFGAGLCPECGGSGENPANKGSRQTTDQTATDAYNKANPNGPAN